jgi:hypothetical protein
MINNPDFKPLMTALARAFQGAMGYEFQEQYMGGVTVAEPSPSVSAGLYISTGYYRASVVFTASEDFRWKARHSEQVLPEETIWTLASSIQESVKRDLSASGRFKVNVGLDENCAVQRELAEVPGSVIRTKVALKMDSGIVFMECAFHVPESYDLMY